MRFYLSEKTGRRVANDSPACRCSTVNFGSPQWAAGDLPPHPRTVVMDITSPSGRYCSLLRTRWRLSLFCRRTKNQSVDGPPSSAARHHARADLNSVGRHSGTYRV